ncbi:MAG: nucleoside deaminase [Myxococcota bacterium]
MTHSTWLHRAISLALDAEAKGHLPIAALVVLNGQVIAEGTSEVPGPPYHPGRHAEVVALSRVPVELWPQASKMTVVSTLEPCLMCFGTCLLHGIGEVVYGATDVLGGAGHIMDHLPPYYEGGVGVPTWTGPLDPARCDPLYHRVDAAFAKLPVGRERP